MKSESIRFDLFENNIAFIKEAKSCEFRHEIIWMLTKVTSTVCDTLWSANRRFIKTMTNYWTNTIYESVTQEFQRHKSSNERVISAKWVNRTRRIAFNNIFGWKLTNKVTCNQPPVWLTRIIRLRLDVGIHRMRRTNECRVITHRQQSSRSTNLANNLWPCSALDANRKGWKGWQNDFCLFCIISIVIAHKQRQIN